MVNLATSTPKPRISGTWETTGNRERLVNPRGIVVAEIWPLRMSGRWAYKKRVDGRTLLKVVGSREEARRRAEG